jgi:hypothetical protein
VEEAIFVGVDQESKGYRIWWAEEWRVGHVWYASCSCSSWYPSKYCPAHQTVTPTDANHISKICYLPSTVRGHQRHICQWLAKAALTGVGRLKLVECHWPCPCEDTLYQIYIP